MQKPQKASLKSFFRNKPQQHAFFRKIRAYVFSLGNVKSKVTKTQISFAGKRQFAWVWLPQPWDTRRPKNCVILSFALDKRVKNRRIVEAVTPYPKRWMHHLVIAKSSELDGTVFHYLRQAHAWGNM